MTTKLELQALNEELLDLLIELRERIDAKLDELEAVVEEDEDEDGDDIDDESNAGADFEA